MKSETYLKTFFVTLFLSASAFAQGFVYQGTTVVNGVGQPIAGASVAISTANPCGTSPTYTSCNGLPQGVYTGSTPPASLATLYTDVTVGTTTTNPLTTDSLGNWSVYVKTTGTYWATIYGPRLLTEVYPLGVGGVPITSSTEIGDIIRYNVKGDGLWDSTAYPQLYDGLVANYVNVSQPVGLYANIGGGGCCSESVVGLNPTITNQFFTTEYQNNVQSTSTIIGLQHAENGNNALFHVRGFWRMTHKLAITASPNMRFYWGLAVWNNGSSLGTNATHPLGTTAFATDTPNHTFVGWRWSATTDTNFKCVVIQAGASPTQVVVDSGVAADSNLHTFDVTLDAGNTTFTCYIDGTSVGTIPASTLTFTPVNAGDALAELFFVGDNKNTATAIQITFASMFISLRQ